MENCLKKQEINGKVTVIVYMRAQLEQRNASFDGSNVHKKLLYYNAIIL